MNGLNQLEKNAVKSVAKLAPWLAPIPSAFFVGRSAIAHLNVPVAIAIVIAAIVETLGLASVHTWLWLTDWNRTKRKSDPTAPAGLSILLAILYLVATVSLTTLLEVAPRLATYAPPLFSILAVVGGVNLALISQQEHRENTVMIDRQQRRQRRQSRRQAKRHHRDTPVSEKASNNEKTDVKLDAMQAARLSNRDARLDALMTLYQDNPDIGATAAGDIIGVARQTIYTYNQDLVAAGRIRKNGDGWHVLEGGNTND